MIRASHLLASLFVASCAVQSTAPTAVRSEMAPTGVLRAGINYGNSVLVQRDPAGGAPRGVAPDLARELARRLGVPIQYVTYDTAGKMADAVKQGAWDVAFLAVDPARAEDIAFSKPYVQIEGTYLVRKDSALKRVEEFDRKGVRIAAANKSAYDLYLSRNLKNAEIVRLATSQAAIDEVAANRIEATGGVRLVLVDAAKKNPSLRVVEGNFMTIGQAAGVPKSRPAAAAYLGEFIEDAKRSCFVARSLAASGQEASVAP